MRKFRGLFEEVHRSNMSKTCATMEEAEATVAHYAAQGQEGIIEPSGEVFLVYRISDRKVLKNKILLSGRFEKLDGIKLQVAGCRLGENSPE